MNRDHSKKFLIKIGASSTITQDFDVVPIKETWLLSSITISDINLGDNRSSVYEFMYGNTKTGFDNLMTYAITGATQVVEINKEIVGDGSSFLRLNLTNNSLLDKILPIQISLLGQE